ncbi:MAG TPA: carbonic anhydrase family protein [Thermoanaerobaculia bacterium]|nr:carbonic anhydrase family protein [Thermoanaerobaculia bacterium]
MKATWVFAGLLAMAVVAGAADEHKQEEHKHWGYAGKEGPSHWAELSPENAPCRSGKEQSPINIVGAEKANLPEIAFAYTPGPAEIVNNGHTVQVTPASGGSIRVGDAEYQLVQFHFHHPSEERFSGKQHPMVAHLVHKNALGKFTVVAVEIDRGEENAPLQPIFRAMPGKPEQSGRLESVDAGHLLPTGHAYYAYEGSLTTPPCTEGVHWMVLKAPIHVSAAQLAVFTRLYPADARPVQPLNGRHVEESR